MKNIAIAVILAFSLLFCNTLQAQLHPTPECGQNFNLNWTTSSASEDAYWRPGTLSNTYSNVDDSGIDIKIEFTGETSTLGFWSGQTPKIGTQSSYLYKGIDLLTNGFSGEGITCTITFSQPIYALSFDIHHINVSLGKGDKYTIKGKDVNGNDIYPKFNTSAQPPYTVDETTGIVNAVANLSAGENPMLGVNFADSNYIKSITILWEDCDTCNPESLHATGIGNFSFCKPQTLDFDGTDDYVSRSSFLGGQQQATLMSWIKLDDYTGDYTIMGQPNCMLFVDSNNSLRASLKTDSRGDIASPALESMVLDENIWYHVALIYDGINGNISLFINGEKEWEHTNSDVANTRLSNSSEWSAFDFEIGRNSVSKDNYFDGSINEIRVYNKALAEPQLQAQIFQKIESKNESITGAIAQNTIEGLSWRDLLLYYPMEILDTGYTADKSNYFEHGLLHNMEETYQDFDAPLPFVSKETATGDWKNPENWLQEDVWDAYRGFPEYAILRVKGNLDINENATILGLIVDSGASLSVKNDSGLFNTSYLRLDGTLSLDGDSQLIQASESLLDPLSSGVLEKELKGTADKYTYNYWASPVGRQSNSTNNNSFTVKDIFADVNFLESGYDGVAVPLGIADYWIWKFSNNSGNTTATWQQVRSSGEIMVGEGFTMKGPGSGTISDEQNYTLRGKPNNGTVEINVTAGSDYLVGNPYPSAIDAIQFLKDNKELATGASMTSGTLYFWKHWGGSSHVADNYQGGYATFSLSGGVPAASKGSDSPEISTGGTPNEIPGRYIPVGQGFYLTATSNGKITFNNSQRVLYHQPQESSTTNKKFQKLAEEEAEDPRTKIRLGFTSPNTLRRQLLLTIDKDATPAIDWGYDSKYIDTQIDDMYWIIQNQKHTIQGTNEINEETVLPLGIHTDTDGFTSISIDKMENTPNDVTIYLHDKELNIYHDLTQGKYEIFLSTGEYLNRFEIAFSQSQTLSAQTHLESEQLEVYFSNERNSVVINNPSSQMIESVEMFNILGQLLFQRDTKTNKNHLKFSANHIPPNNYILKIETEYGTIAKKVAIL